MDGVNFLTTLMLLYSICFARAFSTCCETSLVQASRPRQPTANFTFVVGILTCSRGDISFADRMSIGWLEDSEVSVIV